MCLSKRRFTTIEQASAHAAVRQDRRVKLYAYQCPHCSGIHFTKHPTPIDPSLKDRVNIEMP